MTTVSAIIVTRGDVDLQPIFESLPPEWEIVTWDNGRHQVTVSTPRVGDSVCNVLTEGTSDLSVYGRYAAIEYASGMLIWVQDDDCIVSDPQAIVDEWWETRSDAIATLGLPGSPSIHEHLVANMPERFRQHYPDSCLVGFGAVFHRDLPDEAFALFAGQEDETFFQEGWGEIFERTCDVVFTALTSRILVDVPVEILPYAHGEDRMWKQPDHVGERTEMLRLARQVRDA